jgi:hypothetical protein
LAGVEVVRRANSGVSSARVVMEITRQLRMSRCSKVLPMPEFISTSRNNGLTALSSGEGAE